MIHEYNRYMFLDGIRNQITQGKSIYDLKLRVTYYGRVSTDSDEQASSVVNQMDYFISLINNVSNWTYVEGYVDEGISGKNTIKRDSFLRMINDAKNNMFDLILTKNVPRFARNTLDSIKYTQELLKYGIGVYFLNDNINTILPDSEFRLTLMASIAQDDLRKLSENVRFGLRQSVKRGVVLGSNNIFGYKKENGKLIIIEDEAKVVRKMFDLYDSYSSLKKVSSKLEQLKLFNRKGNIFDGTTIRRILMNPKYKGYYCGNKSQIIDYKTGIRKVLPKDKWILYEDRKNVPPIVSEELWNKVNKELEKKRIAYKKNLRLTFRTNYAFSGKLICKEHNVAFTRSGVKKGRVNDQRYWSCRYYKKGIKYCESPLLKESELDIIFKDIINQFLKKRDVILNSLLNRLSRYSEDIDLNQKICSLNCLKENAGSKKEKLLELAIGNFISSEEFKEKNDKLNNELDIINKQISEINVKLNNDGGLKKQLDVLYNFLNEEFDDEKNFVFLMDILIGKILISKVDNNRNIIKLNIIFKLGTECNMIYNNKILSLKQLFKLPKDTFKFIFDELKKVPLSDC